jgi:NADPH-dependent 2,4-dienoyl-CoA reductase/sulfur reductase-like enzyme
MSRFGRIAVVGASLAGLRATEFLRRAKFEGELLLIGDDPHPPYDRPPLSKEFLRGEWDEERIALRRKSYDDLDAEVMLGRRVASLDGENRILRFEDGGVASFDGLVIATGGLARRLPNQPDLDGVLTLRTLDEARRIRSELDAKPKVAVIGAGFIGAEIAASMRQLGLDVTMIEAAEVPLIRGLGPTLGARMQGVHEQHGVHVMCGRTVQHFEGDQRVRALVLDDGSRVECDLAVVGIGMTPATDWLEGSGIELGDGVVCDETLATAVSGIVAAGDVASWPNPLFGERMRVEHWTNAVEQARHAVNTLLAAPGEAQPFESVPMFWSDQYDIKIQGIGRPRPTDELTVLEGSEANKLVAIYGRDGAMTGAVTFNQAPKLIKLRMLMAKRGALDEALEIAHA